MAVTRAGFVTFIRDNMGITTTVLPDASTDIDFALNWSIEIVHTVIQQASEFAYDFAVYNLGGHNLIEFANDQPNQSYFADARKSFNLNGFVPGVINSSSDNGTSESLTVPKQFDEFTISNLQHTRTPWGRTYLGITQKIGQNWGLS